MKFSWTGFLIGTVIFTAIFSFTWKLQPGQIALVQKINGEQYVEDRPGFHWTIKTPVIMEKKMLIDSMPGGTLYEGKTSVGEHFDLESPNKNLVRIK